MPFYLIKIVFENNIMEMMTIISKTNCRNTRVHFYKLSVSFPFEFSRFLPVFDFLTLTDQVQVQHVCL